MITLGIRYNMVRLLNNLGWVEMLRPMRGFENFTYEFLSSLSFTKDRSKSDNLNHKVSFWLLNVDYEMSLEHFCNDYASQLWATFMTLGITLYSRPTMTPLPFGRVSMG